MSENIRPGIVLFLAERSVRAEGRRVVYQSHYQLSNPFLNPLIKN